MPDGLADRRSPARPAQGHVRLGLTEGSKVIASPPKCLVVAWVAVWVIHDYGAEQGSAR
jgi:hypothetical protein